MHRPELPQVAGFLRGARAVTVQAWAFGDMGAWDFQVFMFAVEDHAEIFRKEFDGERMHPSEKGRGTHWSQWKKGSYRPKSPS